MEVIFDWELDNPAVGPENPVLMVNFREFFREKYRVLGYEMDLVTDENIIPCVVIYFRDLGIELQFVSIPDEFLDRVKRCVTQKDLDYIINVVGDLLGDKEESSMLLYNTFFEQ